MNSENKKKRYNKKLIIGIIITTLILVIGTSYAFFTLTLKAEKELSVTTGTFRIDYKEQNTIFLENAYPMSDQKAMTSPVYEFSIENIGDIKALYDISLEEKENSNLNYTWLKYSLKKNEEEWSEPRKLTSLKLEEGLELNAKEKDTYQLRLWIDENVGNEAQGKVFAAKVVVNSVQSNAKIKDIIPPVITLNGSLSESVEQGAEYTDPGVESVIDDHDELSVSDIELSYKYFDGEKTIDVENIDTSQVGVYYIYYKVKDANGNEGRIVRSVNVYKKDTTPPVIRLNGEKRVTVEKEQNYEELGATASKGEEDLTNRIVTIGKVNTKKAGMYEVKYLITDQSGNTASIVRIVHVVYISDGVADEIIIDLSENPRDKVQLTGENLGEVTYTSSDESIASVDSEGNIEGHEPGEITIKITTTTGIEKEVYVAVVKTVTATYVKQGSGVSSIGKSSGSCEITEKGGNCEVTAPTITVNSGYTAVGWNTDKAATTGTAANSKITLSGSTTYYSISYKNAITYTVNFNANGNTIAATSRSCTIPAAYNGASQATSCNLTTPVITAPSATPTVIGYHQTQSATSAQVESNANLNVTSSINGKTYYAITRKDAVTRSISYNQGKGVSSIGKTSDSCTIAATYNGKTQGTSCNVTIPTLSAGVGFTGAAWYTSNATAGTAYAANTSYTLSSNTTLYAVAKRNFTCASAGSTTSYAGSNWYTVANDGVNCTLALNAASSSTGTYAEATNKLTTEYFKSGTTLLNEKNAGLTSILGTYTATNGVPTTTSAYKLIWTGSNSAVSIGKNFPYYTSNIDTLFYGNVKVNNATTILPDGVPRQWFVTGYNTSSTSKCNSISGANCVISSGTVSSSAVSNHASSATTSFYLTTSTSNVKHGSATNFKMYHDNFPAGTKYSFDQYQLDILPCGGTYHSKVAYRVTAVSSTAVNNYAASSGSTSKLGKNGKHIWYIAGVASSTTTTSGGKVYRTYNSATNSTCLPTYDYTFGNASYPISYRLYIRVKM